MERNHTGGSSQEGYTGQAGQLAYRPVDERNQLNMEIRSLSDKLLNYCIEAECVDEISLLTKLSQELDEINAKLKMHIRNLKTRDKMNEPGI
jgi:hypothetical protein